MSTQRQYTPEDKAKALLALEANSGNVNGTARELGMPEATLRSWKERGLDGMDEEVRQIYEGHQSDLGLKLEGILETFLPYLDDEEAIEEASLKERSVSFGILVDKYRLVTGRSTANVEERRHVKIINVDGEQL